MQEVSEVAGMIPEASLQICAGQYAPAATLGLTKPSKPAALEQNMYVFVDGFVCQYAYWFWTTCRRVKSSLGRFSSSESCDLLKILLFLLVSISVDVY